MRQLGAFVFVVVVIGCSSNAGPGSLGADAAFGPANADPRCEALCTDDDARCDADEQLCFLECQARIAGLTGLCATCLLEHAEPASCGISLAGEDLPCCPDPSYGRRALECASLCEGQRGDAPSVQDGRCLALCASDDARCANEVSACMTECQLRISGVSGLCATCLLEGAHRGSCGISLSGEDLPCCPDPSFTRPVTECAPVCN